MSQSHFVKKPTPLRGAERIRVFGHHPLSTLKDYIETSEIKEVDHTFDSSKMVTEILHDFEIILTHLAEVHDTAANLEDVGTLTIIQNLMEELEKTFWMYSAFNEK
jgi:starvation-inducible DNA-binding protein